VATLTKNSNKLGTAFHETFKLNRSGLSQVLAVAGESNAQGAKNNAQAVKDSTSLGNNQVKSSRRYAKGTGLLDEKGLPTIFGQLCLDNDPALLRKESQWLLHYNLSAPCKNGPLYWNHLFCDVLNPGQTCTAELLVNLVESFLTQNGQDALAANTYKTAVAVLTGTYLDKEALGGLHLIESSTPAQFQVLDPALPAPTTFACMLADFWENMWPDRADILLSELTESPLVKLLLAEGRLGALLREVEKLGLIRVQRRVPPYQVFRLWDSAESVFVHYLFPVKE
jgi:hypothetical protein